MTKEDLIQRIQDIEWDDFEAKAALNDVPKEAWESVSSFSNTSGGWLLFGVVQQGKRFTIEGVNNPEKIESDFLTALRGQKFNHKLFVSGKKFSVEGKTVLGFYIPSSELKPIWFNSPVNTFIRSASEDQRATDMEIAALYRDQAFGSQSEKVIEGTGVDDLNMDSIETYRNHIRNFNPSFPIADASAEEFFRATAILVDGKLTYASLLMFGKHTSIIQRLNNFWIDYLEIPGSSYSDATVRYSYRLPEQENLWEYYRVLIQRLRLHIDAAPFTSINTIGAAPDDESQLDALREGLVNLMAHSDYFSPMHPTIRVFDNRIEFLNPGRLVVDKKDLGKTYVSKPRNPGLLKFFRFAKLGENAGYGIEKIYGWERLTGQKVDFQSDTMSTTVTYFRPTKGSSSSTTTKRNGGTTTKTTTKTATNNRAKILKIMRSTPTITLGEIASLCGIGKDGVRYHINYLKKNGYIRREGGSKGGRWIILKNI